MKRVVNFEIRFLVFSFQGDLLFGLLDLFSGKFNVEIFGKGDSFFF